MRRGSAGGFTLVELMIAVAVVAIIIAVGLPSYQDQVLKTKRAEGKAALLKAAQLQERFYSSTQLGTAKYASDLSELFGLPAGSTVRSGENPTLGNYTLTVAAFGGSLEEGFLLTATPNNVRATGGSLVDPECGDLTLTSTGVRAFTGTGTKDRCW